MPPDPNKVFEITITSFIKVNYKGDSLLEKGKHILIRIILYNLFCDK